MSSDNLRIKDLGNGLKSEAVAADIHFTYNPATGSVRVEFSFADYVTLADGTPVGDFTGAQRTMIAFDFSELATRKFGAGQVDAVSGLRLENVSGMGVMTILKAAADILYNERMTPLAPILPIIDTPTPPPEG